MGDPLWPAPKQIHAKMAKTPLKVCPSKRAKRVPWDAWDAWDAWKSAKYLYYSHSSGKVVQKVPKSGPKMTVLGHSSQATIKSDAKSVILTFLTKIIKIDHFWSILVILLLFNKNDKNHLFTIIANILYLELMY